MMNRLLDKSDEQKLAGLKKGLLDFAKDCEQLAAICDQAVVAHRKQSTACQQTAAHYTKQSDACLETAALDEMKANEYRQAARNARENAKKF